MKGKTVCPIRSKSAASSLLRRTQTNHKTSHPEELNNISHAQPSQRGKALILQPRLKVKCSKRSQYRLAIGEQPNNSVIHFFVNQYACCFQNGIYSSRLRSSSSPTLDPSVCRSIVSPLEEHILAIECVFRKAFRRHGL